MIHDPLKKTSKDGLVRTKKKLSTIFALLVFGISVVLTGIFLSYKYNTVARGEKTRFLVIGTELAQLISNRGDFLNSLQERRDAKPGKRRNLQAPSPRPFAFSNFIILEDASKEIVFYNINKDFEIEDLHTLGGNKSFSIQNGIMIQNLVLKNIYAGHRLILFQEMRYDLSEFIEDLLLFIFISLVSSLGLYYIGYAFVSKNLKPVEINMKNMQDFIHNAGHELKTPLSIVHSNLQLLGKLKKYDPNLANESLKEINKLDKLIESLVELSDLRNDHERHLINLGDEIQSILKDFSKKSEAKNIQISLDIGNQIKKRINREYFYIFFSNLVGNAIKYNKKGGKISIQLNNKVMSIQDTGIGIPYEKQDKIFERFYKAHERSSQGYGIGLSLVRKIADIYGWKIQVESKENSGTAIHVKFK